MGGGTEMASWAPTVKAVSSCTITPRCPTPPQRMFLPASDIMWRWLHYIQVILFFKLEQPHRASSFIEHLKSSLALALVEFFPVAGRLFEQADGRLSLDCNDSGVPFIEASVDLPFSSVENDGFQHKPFFKHLAPHGDLLEWTGPELPLLSVQVTRFADDEGFVVGLGLNHVVADGMSFWHFMKSWGECARGEPISMCPLIHIKDELRLEKLILPLASQSANEPNLRSITQGGKVDFGPRNQELAQRNFHFTSEMVKRLKHMVASSFPPSLHHAPFSSLQVLSAHIWRHVLAATNLEKGQKSAFFLVGEMRARLVPPFPEAYFGNAIHREATIATVGELHEESLGETAMRIQELIKSLDDKNMKTFLGKVEVLHPSKVFDGFDFNIVKLQISCSHRFPVYDVDFGWGPPLCVRCPRIRNEGEMMWFPGPEGGGSVDVSLALTKPIMENLDRDVSFLSF